jgi:hypothetical protein
MKILAVDLGKYNCMSCLFDTETNTTEFETTTKTYRDVALQRVGSSDLCSNLWRAEDAKENIDHGISSKIVSEVLGNVET